MKRRIIYAMLGLAAAFLAQAAVPGAEPVVGPAEDVAPRAEGTRCQAWPRAAWSEGAKCWLVVWCEGFAGEQETDIWCARVSADGKALDPAGLRVTKAKDIQERPVVASDGKGFLVAWGDYRNGKDWDVYAARVSGDGKVLDPDGLLVAGGEHSQVWPTVAFAAGNYMVVWQNFVPDVASDRAGLKYGSYELRGARVSPEGKVLDTQGLPLAAPTAYRPEMVANAAGGLWLAWIGRPDKVMLLFDVNGINLLGIDAVKGAAQGAPSAYTKGTCPFGSRFLPALAGMGDKGGFVAATSYYGGCVVYPFNGAGKAAGEGVRLGHTERDEFKAAYSAAADGERCLITLDCIGGSNKKLGQPWVGVWGWFLGPDGKVLAGEKTGFQIAAGEDKDRMHGFGCAGPKGAFLAVYSETRGVDDVKVVARLVK